MAFLGKIVLFLVLCCKLTFALYTLICLTYIGRPFTVKNSPVEGTGHLIWAIFRQHDTWIISTIIFEALTES